MTWAALIAQIESELPGSDLKLSSDQLRTYLVRAYTHGFLEGFKRINKAMEDDTKLFLKAILDENLPVL